MANPSPERWERLKALFKEALDSDEAARRELLARVALEDATLGSELRELVEAHGVAGRLLDSPPALSPSGSAEAAGLEERLPERIGRYGIRRLIASGGMGRVYEGEQAQPRRAVAVKVLRRDIASKSSLRRFEHEAEFLARLQHPAIAQIIEAGIWDDGAGPVPYFAMEYLPDARPITRYAEDLALDTRARLALFLELCDAVHFGHQQGVIHRDLKPTNVLVDAQGRVKVIDFGVARSTDSDVAVTTMHTEAGQLLGTIQYMSPEQLEADPKAVDTRSDIYALGVVLFELLSGRPPIEVADLPLLEAARAVRERQPPRLGTVDRRWRGDLETIVTRALDKERDRRYGSAAALADDIRRHLAGEAIIARPTSVGYQLRIFARRHKALVAGVAAVMVALAVGMAGTTAGLIAARRSRTEAEVSLFDMITSYGLKSTELGSPAQGYLWFTRAADSAAVDPDRARANLVRLKTWRRHVAMPAYASSHAGEVAQLEFDPSGRYLLTVRDADADSLEILDLEEDRLATIPGDLDGTTCAAWSPGGGRLARGSKHGEIEIREFPSGSILARWTQTGRVNAVAFSADGRWLAAASAVLRIRDARTPESSGAEIPHPAPIEKLAFNGRGDRLATAAADGLVRVFALPAVSGIEPLWAPLETSRGRHRGKPVVQEPIFLAGGSILLTISKPNEIALSDAETGRLIAALPQHEPGQDIPIAALRASPDGERFVVYGGSGVRLFDARERRLIGPGFARRSVVDAATFSPDGTRLLTGAVEDLSALWSLPEGELLASIPHQDGVLRVSFSPRGGVLATAQYGGLVRVWTADCRHPRDYVVRLGEAYSYAALSADRSLWLPIGDVGSSTLGETQVRSVAGGELLGSALRPSGSLRGGAFSPDGAHVATLTETHLQCWSWRDGTQVFEPLPLPSRPQASAYSPDGALLVIACFAGEVLGVDPLAGSILFQGTQGDEVESYHLLDPTGVLFAPAGDRFVTWRAKKKAWIWDTKTGAPAAPPIDDLSVFAAISKDGRLLATTSWIRAVLVRELSTGRALTPPLRHPDGISAVDFSSDGSVLLTACDDGYARLWDWRKGRVVCPPLEHGARVAAAAFSADGRHVFTVSHRRELRIWDAISGMQVSPPRPLFGFSRQLLVTPRFLIVPSAWGRAGTDVFCLEDLAPSPIADVDILRLEAEVAAGARLDGNAVHRLSGTEWSERFDALRDRWQRTLER